MSKTNICKIERSRLKGSLKDIFYKDDGMILTIASNNDEMSDMLADLINSCNGLPLGAIDRGLINYVHWLEEGLKIIAECRDDSRFASDSHVAKYYLNYDNSKKK